MSEEDKEFHAKYKADRAKANEYSKEWRDANKARYEDIISRREDGGDVSEEDVEFLAEYEADREREKERKKEWRRVDIAEYNETRALQMQSLLSESDCQKQRARKKRKVILQLKRCNEEVDLKLSVSHGRLGLTVKSAADSGLVITEIHTACTFADLVEIGDRIVRVDDKVVNKPEHLSTNSKGNRIFDIVRGIKTNKR